MASERMRILIRKVDPEIVAIFMRYWDTLRRLGRRNELLRLLEKIKKKSLNMFLKSAIFEFVCVRKKKTSRNHLNSSNILRRRRDYSHMVIETLVGIMQKIMHNALCKIKMHNELCIAKTNMHNAHTKT